MFGDFILLICVACNQHSPSLRAVSTTRNAPANPDALLHKKRQIRESERESKHKRPFPTARDTILLDLSSHSLHAPAARKQAPSISQGLLRLFPLKGKPRWSAWQQRCSSSSSWCLLLPLPRCVRAWTCKRQASRSLVAMESPWSSPGLGVAQSWARQTAAERV